MTKFVLLHRTLNDAQIAEINHGAGWSSVPGRAYMNAENGDIQEALSLGMYQVVATLDVPNLNHVFQTTNHIDHDWTTNAGVTKIGTRHRSTSVGDIVVDLDTLKVHICASFDWDEIEGQSADTVRSLVETTLVSLGMNVLIDDACRA